MNQSLDCALMQMPWPKMLHITNIKTWLSLRFYDDIEYTLHIAVEYLNLKTTEISDEAESSSSNLRDS